MHEHQQAVKTSTNKARAIEREQETRARKEEDGAVEIGYSKAASGSHKVFGCGIRVRGAARVRSRCGSEPGSGWRVSTEPGEGGEPGEGEVWLVLEGLRGRLSR